MDDCRWTKFGNLYSEPSRNGLTKPKRVRGQGHKFINMGEMFHYDRLRTPKCDRAPLTETERKTSLLMPNDLLFARQSLVLSGAGKCSIFLGDPEEVSFESHLIRIRINGEIANPLFYYYFFRSKLGRTLIESIVEQGAGASGIRGSDLMSLDVPCPRIPVQHQAAELLGAFDDKIELSRRTNETLEAMARAIFRDWFVDFGPTRAKAEGRAPYLAPELWNLFPGAFDHEGLPVGWEERPFLSFLNIVGGGTPKTKVTEYWGGKIPWFSVVDTPPQGGVFVHSTEKTISERGLAESSATVIPIGTTIITARGTVGKIAMAARDMTFNQSCYGLRAQAPVGDRFVYLATERMVHRLQAMAHGSVFSTITRATFENLTFPWVGEELFARFEELLEPVFSRINMNGKENETLAQTRDLLLPKLMSGEIRLREAEKAVEAVA